MLHFSDPFKLLCTIMCGEQHGAVYWGRTDLGHGCIPILNTDTRNDNLYANKYTCVSYQKNWWMHGTIARNEDEYIFLLDELRKFFI